MPLRDQDLRAHQINARDDLRHRVLHLDARVHLDEKPFVRVEIEQKLDRAGVVVANPLGDLHRGVAQFLAHERIELHRGRDLDHFLMAALDRAIPFVQVQEVAMAVPEHLHLDVLGAGNVFLEKHRGIAKSAARLIARLIQQVCQVRRLRDHARMPRPPPPNAALIISGNPISLATFKASVRSSTGFSVPGSVGTDASSASARAATLSPINFSSSGRGPTNVMPASTQACANSAFSDRNP